MGPNLMSNHNCNSLYCDNAMHHLPLLKNTLCLHNLLKRGILCSQDFHQLRTVLQDRKTDREYLHTLKRGKSDTR